jgi:predicted transcriptional regulator
VEKERVGEIMIPLAKYPHVRDKDTIGRAIRRFLCSQISVGDAKSLPRQILVFDANNKLLGALRRREILRGLEPEFLSYKRMKSKKKLYDLQIDPNLLEMTFDKMVRKLGQAAKRPVSDIMRPIEHFVDCQDHIMKAIYLMVHGDVSFLPVTSGEKVVGVVRSVDLFRTLADYITQEE